MNEVFLHKQDIPKNCEDCPFVDTMSDCPNMFCNITNELINDCHYDFTERHSTCPLKILKESELTAKYKVGDIVFQVKDTCNYQCEISEDIVRKVFVGMKSITYVTAKSYRGRRIPEKLLYGTREEAEKVKAKRQAILDERKRRI